MCCESNRRAFWERFVLIYVVECEWIYADEQGLFAFFCRKKTEGTLCSVMALNAGVDGTCYFRERLV